VQVAIQGALQDLLGWLDLGFGRLQDGVPNWSWPGWEGLAEIAVIGILGRGSQTLPVSQSLGERATPGGEVLDPLASFRGLLPR